MPHDACGTDKGGTQENARNRVSHHTLPWLLETSSRRSRLPACAARRQTRRLGEILIEAAGRFKAATLASPFWLITLQSEVLPEGAEMTRRIVLAASFGVLFGTLSVLAHHSAATAYDTSKKITLRGTVTKLEWQNPHVFYYIDVADASGMVTNWAIEASTPNQLYRNGWRKDDLKIGEVVTLNDSSPSRTGLTRAYGGTLTLANGRKVFSGSAASDQ
jgi:hypothetical protein